MISSPLSSVRVAWDPPIADGNSGIKPAITCTSGGVNGTLVSNPGQLLVNCTATDDQGNTASCSFKLTVKGINPENYYYRV